MRKGGVLFKKKLSVGSFIDLNIYIRTIRGLRVILCSTLAQICAGKKGCRTLRAHKLSLTSLKIWNIFSKFLDTFVRFHVFFFFIENTIEKNFHVTWRKIKNKEKKKKKGANTFTQFQATWNFVTKERWKQIMKRRKGSKQMCTQFQFAWEEGNSNKQSILIINDFRIQWRISGFNWVALKKCQVRIFNIDPRIL